MAHPNRHASYALVLRLLEKPHAFDFYTAVRRIECAGGAGPRVGQSRRLREDPVRFGQRPSLAFAPAAVQGYQTGRNGAADRLSVAFMGLLGPNGPLPLHLTDYARDRERNARDPAFARFLDVFHHRAIALFYRAWAVNQPAVSFDRVADDPDADRFGFYVSTLIGLGEKALRRRDALEDIAKLHFAGRLAHASKPPEGIEACISDYFGVRCELSEFFGRWIDLPPADQLRMGISAGSHRAAGGTGRLGQTAVVGARMWDRTQKFRLRLGPLTLREYTRFLPGRRSFARLVAWIRNHIGYEYLWDAQLVLRKEEVPPTRLGLGGELGWTTWLATSPLPADPADLVLRSPDEADPV